MPSIAKSTRIRPSPLHKRDNSPNFFHQLKGLIDPFESIVRVVYGLIVRIYSAISYMSLHITGSPHVPHISQIAVAFTSSSV